MNFRETWGKQLEGCDQVSDLGTMCKVLAWPMVGLGLIPNTTYGSLTLSRVSFEYKARIHPDHLVEPDHQ